MNKTKTAPSKQGASLEIGANLVKSIEKEYGFEFKSDLSHDPLKTAAYVVLSELGFNGAQIARLTGKDRSTIMRMLKKGDDFACQYEGAKLDRFAKYHTIISGMAVDLTKRTK